jgi:putative transposase
MAQETFAVDYIHDVRAKDPGIGGIKLWHMYKNSFNGNNPLGRDRFVNIVDRYGLKVRRKKRKPRTTDSTHGLRTYPNLIKYFIPTAPNQLWVSDITYITVFEDECNYRFYYLTLVMDAYTEEIKGYSLSDSLEAKYSITALNMALKSIEGIKKEDRQLVHHSDRGLQYASNEYVSILNANNIRVSMTESGNPKDNPQAERINNTVKNELLKGHRFRSKKELIEAIEKAIFFYNNERPHMSINMMTPVQAANCTGERKKKWKSYREEVIKNARSFDIPEKRLPLPSCQGTPFGLRPSVNP